jgi:lysozyme family protein
MADFSVAFQKVLQHEGGYVNDPNDPGGETYKGIARNMNSKWEGWAIIDVQRKLPDFPKNLDSNVELQGKIENFYETNYWDRIKGDDITDNDIASSIFDFAVNVGVSTSCSLAQMVVDMEPDGVIGDDTVVKLNAFEKDYFLVAFTIAKIARYASIVKKRPSSQKYFYGWVRRALSEN